MQPEFQTTIMIVAPHSVQAVAVPILRQYSPDVLLKVPPHFTVMYPFVNVERLREACQTVKALCATIKPFDVTISGYGSFPNVAFLKANNPAPIQDLFHRIYEAFPECPPFGGTFGNDLYPHMTVAHFPGADQLVTRLPAFDPITFRVDRLNTMYGTQEPPLPWITCDVIPLGG